MDFSPFLFSASQYAFLAFGALSVYASLRCFYHLYFHPASKFPGPRLAAVSNVWYAYHWFTGKYPMTIAETIQKYGDVVRIAPNELVFITPQAATDIYASHTKHIENFPKTNGIELGVGDQGITWEKDPIKHRQVAKVLAPAFSVKSIKAKEPIMHKYIDDFVQKMKKFGAAKEGIELKTWTDWVAMDISAELAYSHELHQLKDMKNAPVLESTWRVNFFVTIHLVLKKFPFLSLVQYLFVPPTAIINEYRARKANREALKRRIERRGEAEFLDHLEQLLPAADLPAPTGREMQHIETISVQLLLAGYEPPSSQFLCTIMFSLHEPDMLRVLVKEIRDAFTIYEDITAEALASLELLNASLMESLRLTVIAAGGLPRVSHGSMIDGNYVEKGVNVQYSHLGFTRSPRYFHDPRKYRPQRWLSEKHPQWEVAFKDDARESFFPFSQGPRSCIGMALAWRETRLFIAKVLWSFDVEMLPNQKIVFERDFNMQGMWEKPNFWVRFHPAKRAE